MKHTGIAIAVALLFFSPLTHAWEPPTVEDVDALSDVVDNAWTNNGIAKIIPPGDFDYNNSLGVIGYAAGFDTNILASLVAVTNGIGTNTFALYPVEVIETTSGTSRVRYYLSAVVTNPFAVYTTDVDTTSYPEDWIDEVYGINGEPPYWLSGDDLQTWYIDRDPMRQHVFLDLLSTSSIPAFTSWLTNSVGTYTEGTNTNSLLTVYSNDIAVVGMAVEENGVGVLLHAPTNMLTLDLFMSTNLLETLGWTIPATVDMVTDPTRWLHVITEIPAFYSPGDPTVDTDGDGLADIREVRIHGTSATLADTDGDGLNDGDEVLSYGLNPLADDSDGDGISDDVEVELGTNPTATDSDGDGIMDFGEVYTYFGHVDPMDADTDNDQLTDYAELITYGTYPRNSDTDQDGLSDSNEVVNLGTSPLLVDTDGDGVDDSYEVDEGWNPNNASTATDDEDGDGFSNLTEYQWFWAPSSSNATPPTSQKLVLVRHGSNSVQHTDIKMLAVGDQGAYTSRIRVRPYYHSGTLDVQLLYHTQTPGFYINGTEASSLSSPMTVPASSTAIVYTVTSDASARGTNLYIRLTNTNEPASTKDSVRCYFPEVEQTSFWGPGIANYVDVGYGQTGTLWIAMTQNTNDCRVRMDPDQEPSHLYGIGYFHWTDYLLAKVTGGGASPSSTTLNALDWQSAYGAWDNDIITRGIHLDSGCYVFQVGYDMDGGGTLGASEVQEACLINVVDVDADVDTDNNGTIDDANTGEDTFEAYAPGVIVCKTLQGDDTNADHLVELRLSFEPASLTTGTVYITASSGGSRVKLWTDTNATTEVTLPASYDLSITSPPSSLWIDGVDTGEAVIDFYFKEPSGDEVVRDKVAVYVTETPSWGPIMSSAYVYSWQPCKWDGDLGQGSTTHQTVLDNVVSQGWDVVTKVFADETTGDDDLGNCTLLNFKEMRYAPFAAISTHGDAWSLAAVYAASSNTIVSWMGSETGMWLLEWEEEGMWSPCVSSSWIAQNWNVMGFDYRRSITMFMTCNGASSGTNGIVALAGGRASFGYATEPSHVAMRANNNLLFGRMNGTEGDGMLRPAVTAYGGGAGYGASLTMFGNGWTTLCPATVATYPDEDPGPRKGWGCIIFDTYMDDSISASEAMDRIGGGATVSNVRWIENAHGSFALGFDFDNRADTGLEMRANAYKCRHSSGGLGCQLDGDREMPNGDSPTWP